LATLSSFLQPFLQAHVGPSGAASSTAGSLNAKLASLLPYVIGTTGTVLTVPTAAAVTASAPDLTFGTSGFTTLLSSGNLAAHMLTGLLIRYANPTAPAIAGNRGQVDVATGAAAAEIVVYQTHVGGSTTASASNVDPVVVFPPLQWPTNERVSFRVSGDSTTAVVALAATFAQRPA